MGLKTRIWASRRGGRRRIRRRRRRRNLPYVRKQKVQKVQKVPLTGSNKIRRL